MALKWLKHLIGERGREGEGNKLWVYKKIDIAHKYFESGLLLGPRRLWHFPRVPNFKGLNLIEQVAGLSASQS